MEAYIFNGAVISVLVLVIGYFLNKWITAMETAIDKLTKVVGTLNTTVEVIQAEQKNSSANCAFKHETIDKRLNAHSKKLSEHDIAITKLEVGLNDLKEDI